MGFSLARTGIIPALMLVTMVGCNSDVASTELTPDLLEDQAELSRISNRLEPAERALFNKYVMNRNVGGRIFPGQAAIMPDGSDPRSVAEAIELMRAREQRSDEVEALVAERTRLIEPIDQELQQMRASGMNDNESVAHHNELVDKMNGLIKDYETKIEELRAKPLVLQQPSQR